MKNLSEEIREGIKNLIDISYETGYFSAKMETGFLEITVATVSCTHKRVEVWDILKTGE